MQKSSDIQAVLLFIEQNLTVELSPESIAERYFVSLSQLYRDFYRFMARGRFRRRSMLRAYPKRRIG